MTASVPANDDNNPFPCNYGLKIIAKQVPGIADAILAVINQCEGCTGATDVSEKASGKANYVSIRLTLQSVASKQQLEAICLALRAHPQVIMLI